MSEVTAISSLAPSASASQVKKPRPGKRERKSMSTATLPQTNEPSGFAVEKAKSRVASNSKPNFQPGKFPVVFDTSVGEPTVDHGFTPVIPQYYNHVQEVYTSIRDEVRFTDFRANAHLLDPVSERKFKREFESAALCTLCAQLLKSHVAMEFPSGDFGPVTSSDAYHLNSIHMMAAQYGEFKLTELGERFLLEGYQETLISIIRLASYLLDKDDDEAQRAVECWWLPVVGKDRRTLLLFAYRIQWLYEHFGLPKPELWLLMETFFSGRRPPGWAYLITVDNWINLIDPIFDLQRTVPREWWENYLVNDNDASERRTALDLPWRNPDVSDFDWSIQYKAAFGDVQTRWATRRPTLDKFFAVTTIGSRTGDYFGSPTQLSSLRNVESITVLRLRTAVETAKMSLAAVFWPRSVFDILVHRTDAVKTTHLNVNERRVTWVQRDFK